MKQRYLICGDKLMVLNAKVGSSTFARAIVKKYYGDLDNDLLSASYPEGQSADTVQIQMRVPYRTNPDRPVVLLVRDPIERFRSAMAQVGLDDVDAALTELAEETGSYGMSSGLRKVKLVENVHFVPQNVSSAVITAGQSLHTFAFPAEIDAAAEFLGLDLPLISINEAHGVKPDLTEAQTAAVREFYAEDQALWESLYQAE